MNLVSLAAKLRLIVELVVSYSWQVEKRAKQTQLVGRNSVGPEAVNFTAPAHFIRHNAAVRCKVYRYWVTNTCFPT